MTDYRDPRPDEVCEQTEAIITRLLPPERQAYWRQVTSDPGPRVTRFFNTGTSIFDADVRAYQNELLCSALRDIAEQSRLLREALEQAK